MRPALTIFDTAAASDNLGDDIIMDAVMKALGAMFPESRFDHFATHRFMSLGDYRRYDNKQLAFVGGTNILKSRMFLRGNWKLGPLDPFLLRNIVLFGVGWQQYMGQSDILSKLFFRKCLSRDYLHSVRDMYTYNKLKDIVPNVIYTACPTLWDITAETCAAIPRSRGRSVIFAVTYYRPNARVDRAILERLKKQYETVHFWPQQAEDVHYAQEAGLKGMSMIEPSLAAYDALLEREDVDFVGARLHGGIRAIQKKRRSLILAVDNRAIELGRDAELPVVLREDIDQIVAWVEGSSETKVRLPRHNIDVWKGQFSIADAAAA